MFKYAQILGSILRSFPLALAAEIVPKKLNEMTHSKKPGLLIRAIYVEANNE
jgi:hypothetical protein